MKAIELAGSRQNSTKFFAWRTIKRSSSFFLARRTLRAVCVCFLDANFGKTFVKAFLHPTARLDPFSPTVCELSLVKHSSPTGNKRDRSPTIQPPPTAIRYPYTLVGVKLSDLRGNSAHTCRAVNRLGVDNPPTFEKNLGALRGPGTVKLGLLQSARTQLMADILGRKLGRNAAGRTQRGVWPMCNILQNPASEMIRRCHHNGVQPARIFCINSGGCSQPSGTRESAITAAKSLIANETGIHRTK
ncbi:hypothetical protein PGT21_017111 [Puccinia graminis f. sp. tritici]|uniref:Uncharacterized protein n=1 Tax=Puccinia graminis f. sp. tritici TaxID=56615 RepID=A0A5B0PXX0_PUCGR|nr:hypothetical protein PGT21_017111 [Puccinia graminis f. sp. tritici]